MNRYIPTSIPAALSLAACSLATPLICSAAAPQLPSATPTQPEEGFYLRIENGVSSISGADIKVSGPISGKSSLKMKPGYLFGGAAGYRFNSVLSAEIELDHANNDVKSVNGISPGNSSLAPQIGSNIHLKQTSLLASGVFHYPLGSIATLNLGAGAGVQFNSTNLPGGIFDSSLLGLPAGIQLTGRSKSDAAFVAQVKTGISVALTRNLTFDAGYKLRAVSSSEFYSATAAGYTGEERAKISSHLSHVFSAGLTYAF